MHKKSVIFIFLLMLLTVSVAQAKEHVSIYWAEYEGDTAAYTDALEAAFEKSNPDIDIEIIRTNWNTLHDRLVSAIFSKQAPDLSIIGTRWLLEFMDLKVIEPIEPFLSKSFLQNIDVAAMEGRIGNTLYGIPVAMGARIMYYRSDLVPNPPDTFEELLDIAKKIQNPPKVFGVGMVGRKNVENTDFAYYLYGNGGDYFNRAPDGSLDKCTVNSPEAIKALTFMNDLVNTEKVTQPNASAYSRDEVQDLFLTGKLGFFMGGGQTAALLKQKKVDFKWDVAPIPHFKGKKRSSLLVTDSIVMFKQSQAKKAAAKFLEFFYQDAWRLPFDKNTGFPPVTKSLSDNPAFAGPVHQTMIASVSGAKGWPLVKEWPQVNEILWESIENTFQGFVPPEAALNEAAMRIDQMRGR